MRMGRVGGIRLRMVSVALLCALPLVALGVYRLTTNARHEERMLRTEMENAANMAAARVDERLRTADALLVALAATVSTEPSRRQSNEQALVRTLANAPSPISNLFLLDTAGTLLAAARTLGPTGDSVRAFANRGYFNIVRQARGLVVGEIRRSMALADRPWVVVLARAIPDASGQFAGVVSLTVRLDSLLSATHMASNLGSPLVTIFDSSGVVLALSEGADSIVGQQRFPAGSLHDSSGSGDLRDLDGQIRLTGFTRTTTAPWMIRLGMVPSARDARLNAGMREDAALLFLAISLAVLMAYLVGLRVTQPIAALANAARAFERGETGTRAVVAGPREIRLLGSAFNQMAETVERRTAALADSERRYRFLFDSNPLPMWAWDADTMQIMAVNDAAVETYGYERDLFQSLRIDRLLDPSELERFRGARLPFSENRQNAGTWLHRTASGRQIEMEVVTTSSRRLGRASWLSVGIDVTARRESERALARSEDQLRQVQKMEAIGTFAGGISHDFNNLLTGILGYCDLALSDLSADSDTFRDISEVRALAVRGSDLTRQILTVSRKQVVQVERLDPNEVVRSLDRLLRRIVGAHIDLETRLSDAVGTMRADVSQLEQVLLNLTSNARDAMPDGGTLRIATQVVTAADATDRELSAGHGWIRITVSDTGVGMPAEVRARIFEPFFTTKDRGKGTGLGLALAYAMVEQAGGIVRVESEPGMGTTFSMFFPRLDAATSLPESDNAPPPLPRGSETILYAEDETSVRNVATAVLERQGYRVLEAANGESAMALSRAFPGHIDLLLTDVVMPGMSGRELAETIRRLRPGIRVMFASGYSDDEALLGDVRQNPQTFLQKPFAVHELVRRVRGALDLSSHTE
ncbi:MAG: response regulator [Gemmatimonadaceae bacterium]|nr:response regulator [Gemmatimonadaceae bacterium]